MWDRARCCLFSDDLSDQIGDGKRIVRRLGEGPDLPRGAQRTEILALFQAHQCDETRQDMPTKFAKFEI